jgi:hypothetical protein
MKVVERVIVIRQADGSDYVHKYQSLRYQSLTDMIRDYGETLVLEAAQDQLDQRSRNAARFDAMRELRETVK